MAYWGKKRLNYQVEANQITLGDGENTFLSPFNIKRSESSYSRNLSSVNYPSLSVRKGRQHLATAISTPNGMGTYQGQFLHVLDGTTWKRWDGSAWQNVGTGFANAKANFVEFHTETAKYIIIADGTNVKSWDGTTLATITSAPITKFYAVDSYRIFALKDNYIQCSAEGSITDWTTADDADKIMLRDSNGSGTAIAKFNSNTIAWTEHSMHVLYGNDSYDFFQPPGMNFGCVSHNSVIENNGRLYFLDKDAYMVYTGGNPKRISDKVKTYIEGINPTYKSLCCAGKYGKYIYLSIPYGASTTNNLTLEYDTELDTWYPHSVGYVSFVNIGTSLCGIDSTGQTWTINSGTNDNGTAVSWSFITGAINHGTISQKKVLSDTWLSVDLPVGSTLTLSYSTTVDGNDFVALKTYTASATEQVTRAQVPTTALQNIDWYRLKFEGTGSCTIHGLEESVRIIPR